MSESRRLSVVAPYRNALPCLELTLAGLARQTLDPELWEVIIVDDCSAPDRRPRPPRGGNIRVIPLPAQRGPGGARNAGARAASGELLLFLDSDVVPSPTLLERHLAAYGSGASTVSFGHRYESGWPTMNRFLAGDGSAPDSPLEADYRDRWLDGEPTASRAPWLWAYSHNISVPRDLFLAVDGFDEGFEGWGHEDVELGYRLFLQLGRESKHFRYLRDAYGLHVPHFANSVDNQRTGVQNLRYLKRKHGRWDIELYADQMPSTVAAKIARYEQMLAACLDRGLGVLPAALAGALPGKVFAIGAGLAALGSRPGVRADHAYPHSPENRHILGLWTGLDEEFDTVVQIDLWRILTMHDLNRVVIEGLRLAPRLILVQTDGQLPDTNTVDDLRRMLESAFPLATTTAFGGTVLEVCRPDVAPRLGR